MDPEHMQSLPSIMQDLPATEAKDGGNREQRQARMALTGSGELRWDPSMPLSELDRSQRILPQIWLPSLQPPVVQWERMLRAPTPSCPRMRPRTARWAIPGMGRSSNT